MIPVEKRGHASIWVLPAHLIPLGKLQRCLARTESKAWLSLADRQLQLEFCFSSGLGQDSQGHEVCWGGPTLLSRLEVGVPASGMVCGMIEVPGAQAVQGSKTGRLSSSENVNPIEIFYPITCLRERES